MGFLSWFSFETAKERKKREKAYFKKLYPFGEAQQSWEKAFIEELFRGERRGRSPMYHYELLVLREALIDAEHPEEDEEPEDREALLLRCRRKALAGGLKNEEFDRILALAKLMLDAKSLEEMPTKEEVLEYQKRNF